MLSSQVAHTSVSHAPIPNFASIEEFISEQLPKLGDIASSMKRAIETAKSVNSDFDDFIDDLYSGISISNR